MGKAFPRLRAVFRPTYDHVYYELLLIPKFRDIALQTANATFELLTEKQFSLIRYGNGEFEWMLGVRKETSFMQPNDPELSRRLIEALTVPIDRIIIGIPNIFHGVQQYQNASARFWRWFLRRYQAPIRQWLSPKQIYCDSTLTRAYSTWEGMECSEKSFCQWKSVWQNRDVVLIEGEQTRFGVGNDLLAGAASISRILAPAENAFAKYDAILVAAKQTNPASLILIALGPTATVLGYDLTKAGYQAIDIGHLDVEYEWFLRKTDRPMPIPGKYVNEVGHASRLGLEAFSEDEQTKYLEQIVARIDG